MLRTFNLFLFLLAFSVGLQAQSIKILFDATKAETAGNADWVIDADQHNLGYSNGPAVVGQGNESNAQIVPAPVQTGINQSTPETYWKGALSAWGIDLVKKGYSVETLPYNGTISYGNSGNAQDLSNYKVFIVCEPNIVFTSAEKSAILHFVQNGGGLFMVSDHTVSDRNNDGWDSPAIWNDLMTNNTIANDPFGMTFDLANFSETTTNIPALPNDPLLNGVMGTPVEAMWSNGTSITMNPQHNASIVGVVYKNGSAFGNSNVMVAHGTYGNGRFVAFGDSSPCDDGTGDSNDQLYNGWTQDANGNHELLIMNASIWLASSPANGINLADQYPPVSFFPNPFQGIGTLKLGPEVDLAKSSFELFDASGKIIFSMDKFSSHEITIDLTAFKTGFYYYDLKEASKNVKSGKIILCRD